MLETNEQFFETRPNFGSGRRGTFIQILSPEYQAFQVYWNSSYWLAKFYHERDSQISLQPGDPVTVLAIQGITLLIAPEKKNAL